MTESIRPSQGRIYFFLILTTMLVAYLLAVEGMKRLFFRRFATE